MSTQHDAPEFLSSNTRNVSPVLVTVAIAVAVGLWGTLAWVVYGYVPRVRRVFVDFEFEVGVVTKFLLEYLGFLFPVVLVLAVIGGLTASTSRRRWLLLYGLPFLIFAGIFLVLGPAIIKLFNSLS